MKAVEGLLRCVALCPRWTPTIVVSAIIAYLTLVPRPLGDNDLMLLEGADKVVHFLMFGGLSGVIGLDWSRRKGKWTRMSALTVVAVAFIGIISGGVVEILQSHMGLGRSAEWADMVADSFGALTGAVVAALILRSVSGDHPSQS